MANVGTFIKYIKDGKTYFTGRIDMRTFADQLMIVPNRRTGEKDPPWVIYRPGRVTKWAECGKGWNNTTQADGTKYLRLSIVDDSMPRPVSLALFLGDEDEQTDDGEIWNAIWNPPTERRARPGAVRKARPDSEPDLDDEIPF